MACVVAAIIFALQLWKAAREDYGGDEGFSVRRVEAAWPQVYFAFAQRVPGYAEPFDTRHVYDMNPPLYFTLIRGTMGSHPGRIGMRVWSAAAMVIGMLCLAGLVAGWRDEKSEKLKAKTDNTKVKTEDDDDLKKKEKLPKPGVIVLAVVWLMTPVAMFYGHEARPYALPLGMFCASLWALARWGRASALAAGCVMFASAMLGFLTNFHYPWMLGALAAGMLAQLAVRDRWISPMAAAGAMAGMALGIGAACTALLPQWEIWDYVRRNPTLTINWDVLGRAATFPLIGPLPALGPWHQAAAMAVMGATLLLALLMMRGARRPAWGVTALALWLIPFIVPVAGHLVVKAAFFERYTLFCLPGWALTLAWMAEEGMARRGWRQDAALLAVAAVAVNGALMLDAKFFEPLRPRWMPAVEALQAQSAADDYYIVSPEWHISAYAAHAEHPPLARYLRPGEAAPDDAQAIWLLCDYIPQSIHDNFLNRGWKIEPVVLYQGKELWKMKRAGEISN